ncbi:oxidoreductase [Chitinimonas viridis]|uniref:Oxidoreductase n=1 Tax=Chitinimonas viridis TaxID=664880 RepID=A0ABT8B0P5_9NEIS|nr:oxidoreductase [Chitinimonas viridis]MDN3575580.1 oxidoreductase [Chitinimonas viridis]
MQQTTLIAGATGLIGRHLAKLLAHDPTYGQVHALVRRPTGLTEGKLVEMLVDYEQLDAITLPRIDTVFCALGTTIKTAGTQAAFRRVDLDYVLAIARLARERGAQHCLVVSSLGANAGSRVFYNRVKGEMEAGLQALGYPRLSLFRPSVLIGERPEFRLGEKIAASLGGLLPSRLKPIAGADVALAMHACAKQLGTGVRIIESAEIRQLARQQPG